MSLLAAVTLNIVWLATLCAWGLWIYALFSAITSKQLDAKKRTIWVLAVVFVVFFGAIAYLVFAPTRKAKKLPLSHN